MKELVGRGSAHSGEFVHRFRSDLKSGRFVPESVADLHRIHWPICTGLCRKRVSAEHRPV
jgi:hypothetical protein